MMNPMTKILQHKMIRGETPALSLKKKKRCEFESANDTSFLNETGILHFLSGQHENAKKLFIKALNIQNECQNVRKLCLTSQENSPLSKEVQPCTYQSHEYDEGMNVYTTALHMKECFSDELQSATLLYNIGQTCSGSKHYSEAKKWFELSREIIQFCKIDQSDTTSINILKVKHNLGYCCYCLGKNQEAMQYYREVLVHINESGRGKLDLAAAYNCLAVLHFHDENSQYNTTKASELLQMSISIHRKISGDFTKEVGTYINNLGRVYYARAEFSKALTLYKEALNIRSKVLPHDSMDLAATLMNIGQTYHCCAELNEAMTFYQNFVDLVESRLGSKSRDLATAYKCMGGLFNERGDTVNARSMFERALQCERGAFEGNHHPEMASTLNNLATLCYKMNAKEEALNYFHEGLLIEKESASQDHRNVIITLQNIAQVHKDNGDYAKALIAYREAHKFQVETEGESSLEVAATKANIGLMYFILKYFTLSLHFYQQALQVRRGCYGPDHEDDEIASNLNSIGLACYRLGKHEMAIDAFMESVRIKRHIGADDRELAILFHNVASCHAEIGNEQEAIPFFEESLRLEEHTLGVDHPEVSISLQNLGQVYQRSGDFKTALRYFNRSLEIEGKTSDNDTDSVFQLLNIIGNIHLMNGDAGKMMDFFIEAARLRKSSPDSGSCSLLVSGYTFYELSKLHPPCACTA